MLSTQQRRVKRGLDVVLAMLLVLLLLLPLVIILIAATLDTRQSGWFSQTRIGKNGRPFKIYKIRTLKEEPKLFGNEAAHSSAFGRFLRRWHIDEWPQLFNILKGEMSFVGPRPDLPGYADTLQGEDRLLLSLRPGLTGPASLKYRNEEALLQAQADPESYYRNQLWPDKVKINITYLQTYSFYLDLRILLKTIWNV